MLAASISFGVAHGQDASPNKIYSCVDSKGKTLTSDRPIVECGDRDMIERNADGSPRRIVPRQLTEDERAAKEAKEREAEAERTQRAIQERGDRNLLKLYPTKASHDEARLKALDMVRASVQKYEERRKLLLAERKPLLDEAEFYVGKALPLKVKLALDSNDAALAAQEALRQNQDIELARINKNFDEQLERLRKLWAAPPGLPKARPAPPDR